MVAPCTHDLHILGQLSPKRPVMSVVQLEHPGPRPADFARVFCFEKHKLPQRLPRGTVHNVLILIGMVHAILLSLVKR
jgi:hypothetical protein